MYSLTFARFTHQDVHVPVLLQETISHLSPRAGTKTSVVSLYSINNVFKQVGFMLMVPSVLVATHQLC